MPATYVVCYYLPFTDDNHPTDIFQLIEANSGNEATQEAKKRQRFLPAEYNCNYVIGPEELLYEDHLRWIEKRKCDS